MDRVIIQTLTGGWDLVQLPPGVTDLKIQARTAVDIQASSNNAGTEYFTVKSGTKYETYVKVPRNTLYVKGTAAIVVEIAVS